MIFFGNYQIKNRVEGFMKQKLPTSLTKKIIESQCDYKQSLDNIIVPFQIQLYLRVKACYEPLWGVTLYMFECVTLQTFEIFSQYFCI
jgi:hypothetical protein